MKTIIIRKALKLKRRWSNFKCKQDNLRYNCPEFIVSDKKKKSSIFVNVLGYLGRVLNKKHSGDYEDDESEASTDRDTDTSETDEGGKPDVHLHRAIEKIISNDSELTRNEELSIKDLREKRIQYFSPNKKHAIFHWKKHTTSSQDLDGDLKYLLSFICELKNMTHQQKLDFKLGMMQLLKNIYKNSPY